MNEDTLPNQIPQSTVTVAGTTISMQQLQQIYAELTGKSEKISQYYDDPIHLSLADIELLHHKILQTWEQYHVASSSCSFSIYYQKDTKDEFNSFEQFSMQSARGGDSVESVVVEYNFLIVPPNVGKPQTYTVTIRLVSRLALEKRMRQGRFSLPRFLRTLGNHTGSFEISYVDYSIARTFKSMVDEWFETIPRASENKFMKWLQTYSHWIPRLVRFATAIVSVVVVSSALPHFIRTNSEDLLQLGYVVLWSGLGIYSAYILAWWSAQFTEYSVDSWMDISYIRLNRADELEITKKEAGNRNYLLKGGIGLLGSIGVNVAVKIAAALVIRFL